MQGEKVTVNFGGLVAVSEVDFYVDKGEILGLIGPNGAGKTTLFNLISAAIPLKSGKIIFKESLEPFNDNNPEKDYKIAGKTGTSQNQSDGWFIGMVPNLVTGIWVGCEDRSAHFKSITYGQGATAA